MNIYNGFICHGLWNKSRSSSYKNKIKLIFFDQFLEERVGIYHPLIGPKKWKYLITANSLYKSIYGVFYINSYPINGFFFFWICTCTKEDLTSHFIKCF